MSKERMSAEQAQQFDRESLASIGFLGMVAASRGCECQAYVDWFTYGRWRAQGFQVQKGEKGTSLTSWIEFSTEDESGKEEVHRRPHKTHVFCRCQVQRKVQ